MKKIHLIEWGIIIIALIFGYHFLVNIIALLTQLVISGSMVLEVEFLLKSLLVIGLYAVIFFIPVRYADKIAAAIVNKETGDDTLTFTLGKRSLLQVILISLCVWTIFNNVADIIFFIFTAFKNEVRTKDPFELLESKNMTVASVATQVIRVVIALIIIPYSRHISNWLINKNEPEELTFDSKPAN